MTSPAVRVAKLLGATALLQYAQINILFSVYYTLILRINDITE